MRILSLDYDPLFGAEDDTRDRFGSDTSVFDYDVVLWDPEASFAHYRAYDTYMGLPSLSDTMSSSLKADVRRRRTEFKEFLEAGRTLVVVARPAQPCYVQTGRSEYSGTGKNARRTNFVDSFDIWSALPISSPEFQKARGDRIEAVGEGVLQTVVRKYSKFLAYSATMSSPPGVVFAKVAGTSRAIGSSVGFKNGGLLVFIPDTIFEESEGRDGKPGEWPKEAPSFQSDLIDALSTISGSSEVARPAWTADYSTEQQRQVREAVSRQHVAVERARTKLARLQHDAETVELKDQLYLGTGRQLELRVREVLEQLGGIVSDPEPGRDDWKVDFLGRPAVVEIKGVTKSAAEKHAAQLEKWVAGSLEETGVIPKGILVVNTWRELPLADRSEADFPEQMLPYSEGRQHCLVTGLDLFALSCELDETPERTEFWREKIMSTSGRLTEVPDWRRYIQLASNETEDDRQDELSE